jgi:hypothetical protein
MYDLNHCFQNVEVTKLLWVKFIAGANGKVHKVKYKVCKKIKGHNKFLVSKLNSLWKHIGQRKAITTILIVVAMGAYYFSKTNHHVFNENLYVSNGKDYVVQQVVVRIMVEGKKKIVHFVFIFRLHFQG